MWKRKKLNNKSSECNTRFDDTYQLCKYNIGIDYYHIWAEIKKPFENGKSQIIKLVNVILDLMTLTLYTSTIWVWIIITLETEMKINPIWKRNKVD